METPVKGKLILDDGVYEGEVSNYIPHGKGKKTLSDGSVYEGDWADGYPNGKGIYLYACGHIYKGDFSGGAMTGKGKIKYVDDGVSSYEGDFNDGKPHGTGKMIFSDGNICEGEFTNGVPCGKSRWTFPKGLSLEDDEDEAESEPSEPEEDKEESKPSDPYSDSTDRADTDDYDFVINNAGEIMLVIYKREDKADHKKAKFLFDGSSEITLIRNSDMFIQFEINPETAEYVKKNKIILVNEIDDEGNTVDIYEAPIEI